MFFPKAHAEQTDVSELSWNYFIGFRLEEVHHGHLGEVTDVDTSTLNTLFVVDHQGQELLIPAREEFITDLDAAHKVITLELPDGLLTL